MSTLDLVLDRGVLRVAVAYTPPPEEGSHPEFYLHPKTGEPSGVVCELSRIMAGELGVRPEFVDLAWSQHMKALLDDDVDLLMSYTNTPERALRVDFAGPLLPSDIVVMVRNEGGIESTAALDEPSSCIGVEKGSSIVRVAQRHFSRARVLESTSPAPALKNGEFDAWLTDAVTRIFMKQNPELRLLREPGGRLLVLAREYGHPAVRQNDPRFLNWVRNWLQYHTAQGTIDYWCREYWFSWMAD